VSLEEWCILIFARTALYYNDGIYLCHCFILCSNVFLFIVFCVFYYMLHICMLYVYCRVMANNLDINDSKRSGKKCSFIFSPFAQ